MQRPSNDVYLDVNAVSGFVDHLSESTKAVGRATPASHIYAAKCERGLNLGGDQARQD